MHVCTHPVDLKWQLLIKKNFQQEVLALKTDSEDSEEEEDELDDEEVDDEIEGDEEEDSDNDVVDSSSSEEEDEGEEGEEVLEGWSCVKYYNKLSVFPSIFSYFRIKTLFQNYLLFFTRV